MIVCLLFEVENPSDAARPAVEKMRPWDLLCYVIAKEQRKVINLTRYLNRLGILEGDTLAPTATMANAEVEIIG